MKEVRDAGEKRNFGNAARVYARRIGEQIKFETSTAGGISCIDALVEKILDGITAFGELTHPVVRLAVGGYEHASYGHISTPELEVVGFVTNTRAKIDKDLTDADILTAPTKRRRKKVAEEPAI